MKCDRCGANNPEQNSFCVSCGTTFGVNLPNIPSGQGSVAPSGSSIDIPGVNSSIYERVETPLQTKKKPNIGLIIGSAIGIFGLLVGGVIAFGNFPEESAPSRASGSNDTENSSSSSSNPSETGGNSYLDQLWRECDSGDFQSCDDLYSESPSGSEYQAFGDSCGNRNEPSGWCVEVYASGGSSSSSSETGGNSYLDQLWRECDSGDFQSCDDLYSESPSGSEYEAFGDSCGNRNEPSEWCVEIYW